MAELRAGSRDSRMRGLRLCGVPRASSMASLSPKTPCGGFQVHNCLRNFETTCLDTVFNVSQSRCRCFMERACFLDVRMPYWAPAPEKYL